MDWPHFVAQCISFVIVAFLLHRYAYKPILTVLDERKKRIKESLDNAEKIKQELANAQTKAHEIMVQAGQEATKMIEEARAAAAKVQEQETQKAIAAAQAIVDKARQAARGRARPHAGRTAPRGGPAGGRDDREGDRQGADAGRPEAPGRRNQPRTGGLSHRQAYPVKISKQARRDAKELFHACRVNGVLDEAKVRQVVQQVIAAKPRGYFAILSHFQRLVKLDLDRRTARVESPCRWPSRSRPRSGRTSRAATARD